MAIFTYTSSATPAKTHTVTHNLTNAYPVVTVWDTLAGTANAKQVIDGSARVTSVSASVLTVEFNAPITCVVTCLA